MVLTFFLIFFLPIADFLYYQKHAWFGGEGLGAPFHGVVDCLQSEPQVGIRHL